METLEKLRKKYNNLNKERNAIYRKIVELEDKKSLIYLLLVNAM